jgi:hypothetical protein
MRRPEACLRRVIVLGLAMTVMGCSTLPTSQGSDTAESTLPVSQDKVRVAVIDVLTAGGYTVREEDGQGRVLATGYREEIGGPWDWLLRTRFGVGRSLVVATITPEGEAATRLTMQVTYEAKNRIWGSWSEAPTPLPQAAETNVRLVKNALGIL